MADHEVKEEYMELSQYLARESKILIVDDCETTQKLVMHILNALGYENIVRANNGQRGLETLETNKDIRFIVSDWDMPELTGVEFVKAMRQNQNISSIPFLMLTANATKEKITEALKAGVTQYIVKPVNLDQFAKKMLATLKRGKS